MGLVHRLITDRWFLSAIIAPVPFWYLLAALNINQLFITQATITHMLMVVMVYPFIEELCFRGLIQGHLFNTLGAHKAWMGFSAANAITSIAFTLLHLIYHESLLAIAVLLPSLIFGFFKDRYQSIVPGLILHSWYNSGLFWFFTLYLAIS